ncbi:MAG: hypothetical protein AAF564_16430 [Bacteroidota bacterium]
MHQKSSPYRPVSNPHSAIIPDRISNSEQGISNRRSKPKLTLDTRHSTLGILLAFLLTSCNPFAPALEEGDPFGNLLGDQATVDGFFTNFQTAYELRDMSLYEPLLDSSFIFTYNDFDVQVERQWGFAQEIESTRRLFQNASQIRLQWNQIISQNQFNENLSARIVRSFSLNISLESGDGFRGDGNVNFVLTRKAEGEPWKLFRWRDESEF